MYTGALTLFRTTKKIKSTSYIRENFCLAYSSLHENDRQMRCQRKRMFTLKEVIERLLTSVVEVIEILILVMTFLILLHQ